MVFLKLHGIDNIRDSGFDNGIPEAGIDNIRDSGIDNGISDEASASTPVSLSITGFCYALL